MKSKKILVVSLLLLVMVLLAGCGKKNEDKKEEQSGNNNQENQIVASNVGDFAEYKGNIYYWKLNPMCRESSALYAAFAPVAGANMELVKREPNGKETVITNTVGSGKIYIINDTIFYQSIEGDVNKVCSMNLEGNNKTVLTDGEIKYAHDKYLFIQSEGHAKWLATYFEDNDSNEVKSFDLNDAKYIGMAGSKAYFIQGDNTERISVGYFENGVPNFTAASFSVSDYKNQSSLSKNITVLGFVYKDNKVMIQLGDVQGTGHFIQEGWVIEMDADGNNISKRMVDNPSEGAESLLQVTDLPVRMDLAKGLIYTNPEDGSEKVIVDNEAIKKDFLFEDGDENTTVVYSADKIGNKLYIVIDNGVHEPAGDVGWRYSYRRTKTLAFSFDLESGEINKIYEVN